MAGIVVREGETIERALKRFQKAAAGNKAEARKREYFLNKKEMRIYEQKINRKFK
ncbi:30S ribosomal protein S21 [Spiroplasma sp. TIUS-1]|uniref:30S ribosomal protein S21 n=1 Tax=Spiroplasma sp. TIUS-1 TaxID=216963 RepID=UPI0013983307|nr:30S ribosomal protein S21 [Spiroplasma sp. TIUS-1]QHX35905.1 30S ribosomal protein S21 [Spiroplasma sp. TIUS-1]